MTLPEAEDPRRFLKYLLAGPIASGLAGALDVLGEDAGDVLAAVGRFGLGQVWETRSDISLRGLRTGYGLGLVHPSRFSPLFVDLGFTGDGAVLFTFAVGAF